MPLVPDAKSGFTQVIGIGGIGTGVAFQLEGNHTLGREESRLGALLPGRDFCKLHIVEHYIAMLMDADKSSHFRVAAIGVVGDDAPGRELLALMNHAGIATGWVRADPAHPTLFSACFVYPDRSGGNITASNSAASMLAESDLLQASDRMQSTAGRSIALCLPEVPLEMRHRFLTMATEAGNFRAASFTLAEIQPALALNLFSMIDLIALNHEEASAITGFGYAAENKDAFLARCSAALTALQPKMRIVISAGAAGAYAFENDTWSFYPAPKVNVVSTGGAGDALLAGVLSGLAAGLPLVQPAHSEAHIDSALALGVLLASFSVTSPDAIYFQANLETIEKFAATLDIFFCGKIPRTADS